MKLDQLRVFIHPRSVEREPSESRALTRPATWDDLKELGEEIWWCGFLEESSNSDNCESGHRLRNEVIDFGCGPAILITSRESCHPRWT